MSTSAIVLGDYKRRSPAVRDTTNPSMPCTFRNWFRWFFVDFFWLTLKYF